MNCQRFKPAEVKYVTPTGLQKARLSKGVPQVDMSILEVSETFHAPPASAISQEFLVSYPPEDAPVPDRVPKFYAAFQSGDVKPANFVCKYQEVVDVTSSKQLVESVKHPGQRMLG
jgi:hypothetical protein